MHRPTGTNFTTSTRLDSLKIENGSLVSLLNSLMGHFVPVHSSLVLLHFLEKIVDFASSKLAVVPGTLLYQSLKIGGRSSPLLANPFTLRRGEDETFVYACDFSEKAVSLVKSSPSYNPQYCLAFQQDISKPNLTWPFPPECVDAICCIFVLSAISPDR